MILLQTVCSTSKAWPQGKAQLIRGHCWIISVISRSGRGCEIVEQSPCGGGPTHRLIKLQSLFVRHVHKHTHDAKCSRKARCYITAKLLAKLFNRAFLYILGAFSGPRWLHGCLFDVFETSFVSSIAAEKFRGAHKSSAVKRSARHHPDVISVNKSQPVQQF